VLISEALPYPGKTSEGKKTGGGKKLRKGGSKVDIVKKREKEEQRSGTQSGKHNNRGKLTDFANQ